MNNLIERIWKQGGMVNIEDLRGTAFQAEESAHTFRIRGVDVSGEPLALTGTVGAVFLRADNTDVAITGTITDGTAEVTLTDECYDMPGRFGLTIYVTSDEQTVAVYAAIGSVCRTSSGVVSPETGEDVMDLINAINDAIEDLDEAIARIPQDYQDLEDDVAELQDDVEDLQEDVAELQEETNNYAPVIVKDASGEIVSIDDGAGDMKLKTMEVEIKPVQDLHGQESPYPAGGGKNLADDFTETENVCVKIAEHSYQINKINTGVGNRSGNAPAALKANTAYIVSCDIDFTHTSIGASFRPYYTSGTYGSNSGAFVNGANSIQFTPAEDVEYLQIYMGSGDTGVGTYITVTNFMVRLATETDPTFVPYSNICPISGWTETDVTRTGEILSGSDLTVLNGYINSTGSYQTSSAGSKSVMAFVKAGSVKITKRASSTFRIGLFSAIPKNATASTSFEDLESSVTEYTINVPTDCYLVAFVVNSSSSGDISASAQIIDSVKYYTSINTYTYTFPSEAGTVYGGTLTIHQDGTGTLIVDHGQDIVSNLTASGSFTTGTYACVKRFTLSPVANACTSSQTHGAIASFGVEAPAYWGSVRGNEEQAKNINFAITTSGSTLAIYDKDLNLTDETFMQKYGSQQVCYPLASPVSYDLTAQQVVSLLKGQNVLWANCGDVAIEYPVDTKIYIDNLFASITNATGVSF